MTVVAEKKEFVIKQVFTDVESNKLCNGKKEFHFNIPWCISTYKSDDGRFFIYLMCQKFRGADIWSIEAETKMKLISALGESLCETTEHCYSNSNTKNNYSTFAKEVSEKYFVDGNLTIEMYVKITAISGLKRNKLGNFDESMKEFSDVVLKVNDEKFYVCKIYLAAHSTYFKSLFYGNFYESKQSEIELKDVDSCDFQNFLEVLYAEPAVDDNSIDGILQLAEMYDSRTAIRRCEEFFINKSAQSLREKFEAAVKYKMDKLRKKCFSEMKTKEDVLSVIPEDSHEIDPPVWKELLRKLASFK